MSTKIEQTAAHDEKSKFLFCPLILHVNPHLRMPGNAPHPVKLGSYLKKCSVMTLGYFVGLVHAFALAVGRPSVYNRFKYYFIL